VDVIPHVLFTHRYSMTLIRHLCGAGEFPRHHLWGADYLEQAGYGVEYGFFGGYRRSLTRLSWALGGRFGDVEQQAAMLRRTDANTVIYGGEASLLRGLSTLRRAGLKLPLVAVAHGGGGEWIRGLDVAICLTTKARDHLTSRYGRDPALTPLATWGPDLGFASYSSTGEDVVVSAGKTDRDVDTLLRALEGIDVPARIYADRPAGGRGVVEIVQAAAGPPLPYADVLNDLRRASIVAIPLEPGQRAVGLTEINDALALGKPIVMTRTDAIDFDPEQVGCGLSVDPHDVAGWREALRRLADDAALRAEMGRRGRAFAEDGYNLDAFGAAVVAAARTAADRRRDGSG
jgi:glycosyltransferase involved in cell wall biosynthesis